jgi:hypothetical protein
VRTELFLKGILPAYHCFLGGEMLILFKIVLFSKVEETQVSLKRKPSVLEAEAFGLLFPFDNSGSF